MTRKRKPLPLLSDVVISGLASEGKAIAKSDNLVIFVPYVVPGDIVDIQLTKKKHSYAEGKVAVYKKYSDLRTVAFCKHFGVCGGCKWQILPYEEQLKYKQQQVRDNLERIGKVDLPEINPIIGSEKIKFYRNKLEFTFSNKRWLSEEEIKSGEEIKNEGVLGFHIPNRFDKILDIEECWLQNELSNRIRLAVKKYCLENGYSFFDMHTHEGMMRNLIIRTSSTSEVMVIVVFNEIDETRKDELLDFISSKFPEISSLIYIMNTKVNDSITDLKPQLYKGLDCIYEKMEGLSFRIGPKSFYQTNSSQAYELYKIVRNFAELRKTDIVYDLYTGTGTIANFIASGVKKVIGIEYVPEAIEDAKRNAEINGINNASFFAGDMKDVLNEEFVAQNGKPDLIITDPPRTGMHADVIQTILKVNPDRIVYVSCNPPTQARDLNLLGGVYKVEKIQPVDMFPQTQHVENVVLLVRK